MLTKLWSSAITNRSREPRRRIDVNITVPDSINVAQARKAMLKIATADKRVQVDSFVGDRIVLQLRAWVPTPEYLPALRDTTEKSKAAINKMLAEGGEHAEVAVATDPHTLQRSEQTPDLT